MNTKLTLSIDDAVVRKAKKYAKANEVSLSQLIENYLKMLTHDVRYSKAEEPRERYSKLAKLRGLVRLPAEFDYKEELTSILKERYMKLK